MKSNLHKATKAQVKCQQEDAAKGPSTATLKKKERVAKAKGKAQERKQSKEVKARRADWEAAKIARKDLKTEKEYARRYGRSKVQ